MQVGRFANSIFEMEGGGKPHRHRISIPESGTRVRRPSASQEFALSRYEDGLAAREKQQKGGDEERKIFPKTNRKGYTLPHK